MSVTKPKTPADSDQANEAELIRLALLRDGEAIRTIMRTYNQRLYRLARGIIRNNSDAEDIVQDAYVRAFSHLDQFRGESAFSTWLCRITINEALACLQKKSRTKLMEAQILQFPNQNHDPERLMAQRQILQLVEDATDQLPDIYRTVFIARVIEGMSIDETAELLEIKPETIKTRLHRARYLIRKQLDAQVGPVLLNAFPFAGQRCERLTAAVLERLGVSS